MSKKITAIEYSKDLCFKCLEYKDEIKEYYLKSRGYGSKYDSFNSKLQLCSECDIEEAKDWFDEIAMEENNIEYYRYENNIENLIKSLPIQGQELFENQCSYDSWSLNMESQDWIDINLGIADNDIYKKYGQYSPSEINAYHEKFPTCKQVYIKDINGYIVSKCDYGAYGDKYAKCIYNISEKCYTCSNYEKKEIITV